LLVFVLFEFAQDAPKFTRRPATFISQAEPEDAGKASKYFLVGIALTTLFSYLNFKFSALAYVESVEKLISDKSINVALVLSSVVFIVIAHLIFRMLGAAVSFKRTYVSLAYALAFLLPLMTLVLIAVSRFVSLVTDVPWVVIPPLIGSPLEPISPTTVNLLAISVVVVINLTLIAYMVYAYYSVLLTSHHLTRMRTGVGIALVVAGNCLVSKPTAVVAVLIVDTLGPAAGKLLDLFK
jgi:hypothetical protein